MSVDQSLSILAQLCSEDVSEDTKLDLLTKLDQLPYTVELLVAIVRYLKQTKAYGYPCPDAIEIVGTGGSGLPRINVSTPVAILLARMGIQTLKHGNNAATGRVGSFDLIQHCGYAIPSSDDEIAAQLHQHNLAFLYAKQIYPILRHVGPVRKRYGRPTVFNLLGPLLNPCDPQIQYIGCANADYQLLMARAAVVLGGRRVMVVRGSDGLDKATLTGYTSIVSIIDGEERQYEITPADAGLETVGSFGEIAGGDVSTNAAIMREILTGRCTTPHADLIALNVALALQLYGEVDDLGEGVARARAAMSEESV